MEVMVAKGKSVIMQREISGASDHAYMLVAMGRHGL